MTIPATITLIGFGEVGQIFARCFLKAGVSDRRTFDIAFGNPTLQRRAAGEIGAAPAPAPPKPCGGASSSSAPSRQQPPWRFVCRSGPFIFCAVEKVTADPSLHKPDLGDTANTRQVTDAVLKALGRRFMTDSWP